MKGDSPWSLIANLSREDAAHYLDDRKARGFNTLLTSLVEHKFAFNAPNNFYGDPPFTTPNDFSTPNDAYFAHAEYILAQARARGFLVLLAPAYLGFEGKDEGWYQAMRVNGAPKLREYGRYVATRLSRLDNILWVEGGDYDPPDKGLTRAVAEGIRSVAPEALQTAHCTRDVSALEFWGGEPWLKLNTAYTSDLVVDRCLHEYAQPERMPFFLIESFYEQEFGATILTLRTECYGSLLSGACGHMFGNDPIWSFDAKGTWGLSWRNALGSPGARAMTQAWRLFSSVRWETLIPDAESLVLIGGRLAGNDAAAAAFASDGSFGMIYAPTRRTLTVDLARLVGPRVQAQWFDPSIGVRSAIAGSPFERSKTDFAMPNANAGGQNDWLLLVESV